MSGGDNTPSPTPAVMGVPRHRGATNQEARPVPFLMGKQRFGVTFISDKFAVTATAVTQQSGKDSNTVSGYNYYASIAALVCGGPVDEVYAIYLNGDLVWGIEGPYATAQLTRGAAGSDTADFVDITMPKHGKVRLYWGTETQTYDPVLSENTTLTLDDNTVQTQDSVVRIKHSPYRGYCYLVFDQLYLGFNQTDFQNIEVVVASYRKQPWMTFAANVLGDCNAVAVIGDILQNPRCGLGLPDEMLNTDQLNIVGTIVADEKIGISPYVDQDQNVRSLIMQAVDYIGGFAVVEDDGRFSLGLRRAEPREGMPVIDKTLMSSRPTFDPVDWSQTISELRLTFSNIADDLTDDYVPFRSPGNRSINGGNASVETWDGLHWLTRQDLCTNLVIGRGRARSVPQKTGKVPLRRTGTLYDNLAPGKQFVFDYPDRDLGHLIFRVVTRTISDPAVPEFEINFEQDVAYLFPSLGSDPTIQVGGGQEVVPPVDAVVEDVQVPQAAFGRLIELPAALCSGPQIEIAALVARPNSTVVGFELHMEKNYGGGDSFAMVSRQGKFAMHGTLTTEIDASGLLIDRAGFLVQLDGPDQTLDEQTAFDGLNENLLVFIGNEVLSVMDWTIEGDGLYRLFCVRAQFATPREAHVATDDVFLLKQSDLVTLRHKHFQIGNAATFKIATRTPTTLTDLGLVAPIDVVIAGRIFALPPPEDLRVNGDLRPSFATGEGIAIGWSLTNAGIDVPRVKMALEFFALDNTPLGSMKTPAGSLRLQNSALVPLLGNVEQSFRLRARFETERPEGFLYSPATDLVVTKI